MRTIHKIKDKFYEMRTGFVAIRQYDKKTGKLIGLLYVPKSSLEDLEEDEHES